MITLELQALVKSLITPQPFCLFVNDLLHFGVPWTVPLFNWLVGFHPYKVCSLVDESVYLLEFGKFGRKRGL